MDALIQHIRQFTTLSPEALAAVRDAFAEQVLPKGTLLVSEGKTCRHLHFLQQGAVRGYYTLEGKEITHWFAFENDFVTSFHSFITQRPSVEYVQLLEASVLWTITRERLHELMDRFHELERTVRIAYGHYYIRLEERFVNAQFRTAAERYADLLHQAPHILERVPLGAIASYLGISQETLSRVRARL
ncbi:Crp/Fnr family transcriptional regulator [Flaviaesturariibacter amylovorans]|uniref:Crp/Fnr family transcriptional regulator n=1 Tax=Flaviaesturariibacter amylovorans TaxID=1084520 RepID=A0ABP8HUL7_9BACT